VEFRGIGWEVKHLIRLEQDRVQQEDLANTTLIFYVRKEDIRFSGRNMVYGVS
jgi:hypothetical protein